jgi:hypothetical protein
VGKLFDPSPTKAPTGILEYPVSRPVGGSFLAFVAEMTEWFEIRLEHEAHYGRVAFVPQRESVTGA